MPIPERYNLGYNIGVGGAVVRDGKVQRANLFGHNAEGYGTAFGDRLCRCGRTGCLECQERASRREYPLYDRLVAHRRDRPAPVPA